MQDRLDPLLRFHPFTRLNRLLEGVAPGAAPLLMSVGEPQQSPPDWILPHLTQKLGDWGRYPLANGDRPFREAAAAWTMRRYRLPAGMIDPERHILPVAGTRQALFFMALAAIPVEGPRRAALMPNPFYHVYAGAAAAAGAEPIFLSAERAHDFFPDIAALTPALGQRAALAYVCSPANPQGSIAPRSMLRAWLDFGRRHGVVLAFDECYSEIYRRDPPPGALEVAAEAGGSLEGMMVFQSLSKRSGAAGLRSGFIVGDANYIGRIAQLVNYGGVAVPYPILAASTALWSEESHVEKNRALYNANFAIADRLLGGRFGYRQPGGGFFLWLEVGDGERAAKKLWAEAGVKVLPGAYMAQPDAGGRNPGQPYIRVALVHGPQATETGLVRLVDCLAEAKMPAGSLA